MLEKAGPVLMKQTFAMGITASVGTGTEALALKYPSRPITLNVGFAPGGPNDILGRLVAKALSARLGQPVSVENLPGESGNIATEAAVKSAPDGHTLLLLGPANVINISIHKELSYDFQKDIIPVAGITREPLVMVVHPSVPARTVPEFIAYAKTKPADLRVASTGNGSSPHVTMVLFNSMTGLDLPIEHFQGGGPALKNIISGSTKMMFEPMSASIDLVRSGKLRALAVTTAGPSASLPGIPAVAETIAGFEASAVTGIGTPAGTPKEIVDKLNAEINAALSDPAVLAELAATGGEHIGGSPEDFANVLEGEIAKWSAVVKAAGVTAD
ncbi:Bug family tripartite tricarboxylate transporter substrate binding protein [Agaricicola taiwanensis]|uniref:Bug family tripartite tricarboxylate transporter substrate binding protein n=1 Tax=Agaricicola taiwanensis TaxID=591372 RepID=UPI001667D17B|nr:tripartite tricarboxylate transporter substrate-binding protein [Agaricicola taiwanensis]